MEYIYSKNLKSSPRKYTKFGEDNTNMYYFYYYVLRINFKFLQERFINHV